MPAGAGPGRPSKFTPDTTARILQALRGGNFMSVACEFAGVHYTTVRKWLIDAEKPGAPQELVEFSDAVRQAEAQAEVADLAIIRRAAQDKDWRAAAWIRGRRSRERWGDKVDASVDVTSGGEPIAAGGGASSADVLAIASLAARLAVRASEEDAGDGQVMEVDGEEVLVDRDGRVGELVAPGSLHRVPRELAERVVEVEGDPDLAKIEPPVEVEVEGWPQPAELPPLPAEGVEEVVSADPDPGSA